MMTEQQVRDWRIELRGEVAAHNDIPSMVAGAEQAILAINFIIGDTPESDLVRIRDLAARKIGMAEANEWLRLPNPALAGDRSPLEYIAVGLADSVLVAIAAL